MIASRQSREESEIAVDERLFLFTAPALDLALGFDRVGYSREMLMIDGRHGSPARGITAEGSRLVLGDAAIQAAPRRADIVRAVGATQNVKPRFHERMNFPSS